MRCRVLIVIALVLGSCGPKRDQRAACTRAFEVHHADKIERCVREAWTDKRIDCEQAAGGGLGALFCEPGVDGER